MSIYSSTWILILFSTMLLSACVSTGKLKDGDTAFRLGKYQVAVEMLREEYSSERDAALKAEFAYKIAQCYDAMNKPKSSAEWYGKAAEDGFGTEAFLARTKQLMKEENYELAIKEMEEIMVQLPDLQYEMRPLIAACKRAISWKDSDNYYEVDNMSNLNSTQEDFSPVIFEGGDLVFTSGRSSATGTGVSEWTGGKYYDLFRAQPSGSGFSQPEPFDILVNGDFYEGAASFNQDYSEMVYTQCGSADQQVDDACRLVYRYREPDGSWSEPEYLNFFADSVNIGHPSISPDGRRLYFSAVGDPNSYGGADLYYVRQTNEGWGSPINLGPRINTEGNEVFPYATADRILYFSSDGHPGLGGLDIWQTQEISQKWIAPQSLGYPLNSGADDFGLVLLPEDQYAADQIISMGYFSSSRPGGKGSDDIYSFKQLQPPPPPPVYLLRGTVYGKVLDRPKDPNSEFTLTPLPDAKVSLNEEAGAFLEDLEVNDSAEFKAKLEWASEYAVKGSRKGYFNGLESVSTSELPATPGDTFIVEAKLVLDTFIKRPIVLKNIYYDFNDSALRVESFPELKKLKDLLDLNPTLQIEIGSHTDSRGTYEYNQMLSEGRANAVVSWLTDRGVILERIIAVGYGEDVPINRCVDGVECTEEEHQLNRRTTFRVLGEIEIESEVPDDIRVDPKD